MSNDITASQFGLWGGSHAPQKIDLQKRVKYLMQKYPETKDNDNALFVAYLMEYHTLSKGLGRLLQKAMDDAPGYETITRRRREIQKNRTGDGTLEPSDDIKRWRKGRDGAGPVR